MHYKDGTPAKVGDLILKEESHETSMIVVGILAQIFTGSKTCNGNLIALAQKQKHTEAWFPVSAGALWSVTLSDCAVIPGSVNAFSSATEEKLAAVGLSG